MTDNIKIDDHKLTHHPIEVGKWLSAQNEKLDAWGAVKKIYPIYVEVSPFGGCNYRCTFCAKDFLKYKPTKIEVPVLKTTLTSMKANGVKSVLFAGEGEPLLYAELGEIFEHAGRIGLHTALNSNFAVDNQDAVTSAAKNCQWMRASVNAGTVEDHTRVHKCSPHAFERVFQNLELAVRTRNDSGSRCTIGVQAVLLDQNKNSMTELARRARDIGVDYIVIKPYSQHPESITHVHEGTDYENAEALGLKLAEEQTEKFKVFFRTNAFAKAKAGAHAYGRCLSVPVFWAYVRSNGDVSGCNAFLTSEKFRYGNINEASFNEIWEGEGRRASFEHMQTHDISKCRVNCRMDKVNEYLWDLTHPAEHVNFI